MSGLVCTTVFLRHHDKQGSAFVREHRAWDSALFINNIATSTMKEGGHIEVITQKEFRAEVWPNRT